MTKLGLNQENPAIELQSISKRFDEQTVLDSVDLKIDHWDFVSLVGPSGCGKSTLLRLIAGLEQQDQGVVSVLPSSQWANNQTAVASNPESTVTAGKHQIAYVFQEANLLPWLNAFDNVALPYRLTGESLNRERVEEVLQLVGIQSDDFRKLPRQLSGGMKMRVSIARALALRPQILLLDEPFASLDDLLRTQLNLELLRIWAQRPLTILFVTHNISEAVFISRRVAVMSADPGRIREVVKIPFAYPREAALKSTTLFAQSFSKVSAALSRQQGAPSILAVERHDSRATGAAELEMNADEQQNGGEASVEREP